MLLCLRLGLKLELLEFRVRVKAGVIENTFSVKRVFEQGK